MTSLVVISVILLALIVAALFLIDRKARTIAESTPRLRACPICGKELAIGESILAERIGVKKEGRERILIKGCPYCLKRVTGE